MSTGHERCECTKYSREFAGIKAVTDHADKGSMPIITAPGNNALRETETSCAHELEEQ
jgi:hypothetical protein